MLTIVLLSLRDRLPVDLAAHLGAQLPMLVRGAYYDGYQPSRQPTDHEDVQELAAEVEKQLVEIPELDPEAAIASVFRLLSLQLSDGLTEKVQNALPESIRAFWRNVKQRQNDLADA